MIDIEEALQLLKKNLGSKKIVRRPLSECLFLVLARDVIAKRDGPPFSRVAMDGVAISWEDYEKGVRQFPIAGIQAAGGERLSRVETGTCLEVMTGAILPQKTDTVIPFEQVLINDGVADLEKASVHPKQNVHHQGFDYQEGEPLLSGGTLLRSPEIAILASNGEAEVEVYQQPQVGVGVTGNELVALNQIPQEHQIWTSNLYALQAELNSFGLKEVKTAHLPDDRDILYHRLEEMLENDILVLSGGVSKGRFDFVPEVLESLQVEKIFHRVSQRPGQPLYLGKTKDGKLVFGLPGNPVSCLVNLRRYVLPSIWTLMGMEREDHDRIVVLDQDFEFNKPLTHFLPVKMRRGRAIPSPVKGSGDFKSLAYTDGFVELRKDQELFKKNQELKLFQWGSL